LNRAGSKYLKKYTPINNYCIFTGNSEFINENKNLTFGKVMGKVMGVRSGRGMVEMREVPHRGAKRAKKP
jgi:hypothetical protein